LAVSLFNNAQTFQEIRRILEVLSSESANQLVSSANKNILFGREFVGLYAEPDKASVSLRPVDCNYPALYWN